MQVAMLARMDASEKPSGGTDAIGRDRVAYTIADAARLLSLSERTVKSLIASGELVSGKFGRARRIMGYSIEEYALRHREQAVS